MEQTENPTYTFAEREELNALFPGADPDAPPEDVAAALAEGLPLCAAWALCMRRRTLHRALDDASAALSADMSPGAVCGGEPLTGLPTEEEIRHMPRSAVRASLDRIYRALTHDRP